MIVFTVIVSMIIIVVQRRTVFAVRRPRTTEATQAGHGSPERQSNPESFTTHPRSTVCPNPGGYRLAC